ncbi:AbfB domain-containing protein [Streptomyces sp. NPDC012510]|uniref:AbfB domain-containing protein n=1 Tax=Streptomyces sp. NPDC012510 TaxID=3364838 RepID=UPI0036EDCA77
MRGRPPPRTRSKPQFDADGPIKKVVPTLSSIDPVTGGTALPVNTTRSLRSVNSPGRYLRHYDYELRIDPFPDNATFRADSSFTAVGPWA